MCAIREAKYMNIIRYFPTVPVQIFVGLFSTSEVITVNIISIPFHF